uniref:Uncharacterized protein n=2 Tax=Caenorhabditis japonica TaxID=281687 RepID=A0A8R1EFW0_CAEJA
DYLSCREIHRMPRPDNTVPDFAVCPEPTDEFDADVDPRYLTNLKNEYVRHWKAVKKEWCSHARLRTARNARSIELIQKIYVSPDQRMPEHSM